jgi:hypothetical protein
MWLLYTHIPATELLPPILTYASVAVRYSVKQVVEMNACWNPVFRQIFGFHKYELAEGFICSLGHLDLWHIYRIR